MKYITTQPNQIGRLGHQFHNMTTGIVLSDITNCEYIHKPFSGKSEKWEKVFNFSNIFKSEGNYKNIVDLPIINLGHNPSYDENLANENLKTWVDIVDGGEDETLFIVPFDIFPGVLSEKIINHSPKFKKAYWVDKTKYEFDTNYTNIGLHIRRGDITKQDNGNRWLELDNYSLLMNTLREKKYNKPVKFHVFSEGDITLFKELHGGDVLFHLDGSDIDAFRMLSSIDILVTGLSTFSIMSAYLSDGQIYYNKLMNFTRWGSVDNFTDVEYFKKN